MNGEEFEREKINIEELKWKKIGMPTYVNLNTTVCCVCVCVYVCIRKEREVCEMKFAYYLVPK